MSYKIQSRLSDGVEWHDMKLPLFDSYELAEAWLDEHNVDVVAYFLQFRIVDGFFPKLQTGTNSSFDNKLRMSSLPE